MTCIFPVISHTCQVNIDLISSEALVLNLLKSMCK